MVIEIEDDGLNDFIDGLMYEFLDSDFNNISDEELEYFRIGGLE